MFDFQFINLWWDKKLITAGNHYCRTISNSTYCLMVSAQMNSKMQVILCG